MTREEAIIALESIRRFKEMCGGKDAAGIEALDLALSALRGPTREMVERMRGEWISTGAISCKCSCCGHPELKTRATEYSCCPLCMSPMTDEAVDMMLERMRNIWTSE